MAIDDISHILRTLKGFTTVLKSAVCECLLIVLLFVDAALAYLLMRFANYCGLQSPCIICSRLDHVFRSEEPGYYWNLFCSKHRSEISSLISCNIHRKLVDGRSVCENCLSSHIEETKLNSGMQKISSGNFGTDPAGVGYYMCLCCNEPWNPRPNAQGLPPVKSRGFVVAKPNINFPGRVKRRSGTKKIKEKSSVPVETRIGKTGFDPPSYVGYTELKISSESEHDIPFSEDEISSCMVPDMYESRKEYLVHSAPETPSKRMYSNLAKRKQSDANEHYNVRCLHPDVLSDNGLCDSNEHLADQKSNPSVVSDFASFIDKPTSVDVTENPYVTSSRKLADMTEASKNENISINKDRALKLISKSSGTDFETYRVVDDTAVVHSTDEHPIAVHMSPAGEEKSAPVFVMEEPMPSYNNGFNKDRSLPVQNHFTERSEFGSLGGNQEQSLPAQNSSREGIDLRGHSDDDFETTDESTPYGVQSFDNIFTQASDFSNLVFMHESTFNEIEGEDPADRLKRQNEHYRKCMNDLYKELEEERNHSAIAANQAMAMITRLQEEKSALQMETLHYLRLMDEQADHDEDALDKANDLLAEKEKELQDLEAELEFFRSNITDEALMGILPEASINLIYGHASTESTNASSVKDDFPVIKSAWSQFEDEKLYISERLQDLERKVIMFAHHGTSPLISDGEYFDKEESGDRHQQEFIDEKDKHANPVVEGNDVPMQKDSSASNGSVPSEERSSTSVSKDQVVSKGNDGSVSNGQKSSEDCNETGLASIQNEISNLHERLEALVSDCKFLENCLKSLQNGNEGMIFIQGILQELRDLRKLGIRKSTCVSVS